jgi:hyperosmotically inducible protein
MDIMKISKRTFLVGGLGSLMAVAGLTGCSNKDAKQAQEAGVTTNQYAADKATTTKVQDTLEHDPAYKYSQVKVQTYQGIVLLSGFVSNDEQKSHAEQVTQAVPGVSRVVNEILVAPEAIPTGR